jgi:uncharacterized repeat protein (TIGR01451 family)
VSFAALGATPGQVVYGYSLFPNDMFDANDLVYLTDAPLTTSGGINGGDIFGGTFAIFTSPPAETETSEGTPAPDISASKSVEVYDPTSAGLYSLPGNDITYTISVQNAGNGSPDVDTLFMVDSLPDDVEFYNDDIGGGDPIIFTDNGSGMTFDYPSDAGYSNGMDPPTTFSGCNYLAASGYNPNIRHVCFLPSGTMAGGTGAPGFSLEFRARIK